MVLASIAITVVQSIGEGIEEKKTKTFTVTFIHLENNFIQRDLQIRQAIYLKEAINTRSGSNKVSYIVQNSTR